MYFHPSNAGVAKCSRAQTFRLNACAERIFIIGRKSNRIDVTLSQFPNSFRKFFKIIYYYYYLRETRHENGKYFIHFDITIIFIQNVTFPKRYSITVIKKKRWRSFLYSKKKFVVWKNIKKINRSNLLSFHTIINKKILTKNVP